MNNADYSIQERLFKYRIYIEKHFYHGQFDNHVMKIESITVEMFRKGKTAIFTQKSIYL